MHRSKKISKCNKITWIVKQLFIILKRDVLLTFYKMFIKLHLDYADIIYNKPNNEFLCKSMSCHYRKQFTEHL